MNPTRLFDGSGKPITLTREIARGGEGVVSETADANLVAKVYLTAVEPEKIAKLDAMARLATPELLRVAAWPTNTLHSSFRGPVIGFLQARVVGHREIHQLYSPVQRRQHFPDTDWSFLLHVAMNCAAAVESVHAAGHIIGDINQSGILVAKNGTVRLIDCDSFQVKTDNQVFRCLVGVPFFTPPELQGLNFRTINRIPSHDCFGLAVIIFHLLFMGRHPFSGRHVGGADMPIEKAISESRFAFSRNAASRLMRPPPHALALDALHDDLAMLFERAFAPALNSTSRPSAENWRNALAASKNQLSKCRIDVSHVYHKSLTTCPWCSIEQGGGPAFFTSVSTTFTFDGVFNIGLVWSRIQAVRRPPGGEAFKFPSPPNNIVPVPISLEARWEMLQPVGPEPLPPKNLTEPLPVIPKFEREVVPADPIFEAVDVPEIPIFVPDNFVAEVDAKYKKSANTLIRFLFPGSNEYQVARQLAERKSRERRAKWEADVRQIRVSREEVIAHNKAFETWCFAEVKRLRTLRAGLAERNTKQQAEWRAEVVRLERLRHKIAERNIPLQEKWIRDSAQYHLSKSAFDERVEAMARALEKREVERRARQRRYDQLMTQMEGFERQWINDSRSIGADFDYALGQLVLVREDYKQLRAEFDRRVAEANRNQRDLQLRDYLMTTLISDATIPGLGPKRIASLARSQIETAFDIEEEQLSDVDGVGDYIIKELLNWKETIRLAFRFDPSRGIGPTELRSLHMSFHARKTAMQRELAAGEEKLQEITGSGERRLKDLRGQADALIVQVAQAEADASIG